MRPWFVLLALLLTSCSTTIDGARARALMRDQHTLLVDVRSPEEYAKGHLESAINLPVDELPDRLGELRESNPTTIIVYCRSGMRSARAQKILVAAGFPRVENLGAMSRW